MVGKYMTRLPWPNFPTTSGNELSLPSPLLYLLLIHTVFSHDFGPYSTTQEQIILFPPIKIFLSNLYL